MKGRLYQIEIRNSSRADRARARHLLQHCKHSDYIRRHISKNMILKNSEGKTI